MKKIIAIFIAITIIATMFVGCGKKEESASTYEEGVIYQDVIEQEVIYEEIIYEEVIYENVIYWDDMTG